MEEFDIAYIMVSRQDNNRAVTIILQYMNQAQRYTGSSIFSERFSNDIDFSIIKDIL